MRGRSSTDARFERLGHMRVCQEQPFEPQLMRPYRVTFSPATKTVWRVEAMPSGYNDE